MILTDQDILDKIKEGKILISPFILNNLGSNSYDVTLNKTLATYNDKNLDCKKDNRISYFDIPESGYLLNPGEFYLGTINEYSESSGDVVPMLEGKSSLARLGLEIHVTAGFGDIGFKGYWTLEMTVRKPLIIYPNIPIGQLFFITCNDNCINPYNKKPNAKYNDQPNLPVKSMMFRNFKE